MEARCGRHSLGFLLCSLVSCWAAHGDSESGSSIESVEAGREACLREAAPHIRADFPKLLNCMGLLGEAVEVGVQAGVHASSFLDQWQGRRLRLVDKWSSGEEASSSSQFYVDIANVNGVDIGQQHRSHCEARLAKALRAGRAEVVGLDSTVAAAKMRDFELDFVYLDARHDFSGVALDIQAWWPKVKVGGIFAGHDYVDGEFPEGDFFWISALREVLPGLDGHVHVTGEKNRYPSFYVVKTHALAGLRPRALVSPEQLAGMLYVERSKYFALWRKSADRGVAHFLAVCNEMCASDCDSRMLEFTPTQSSVSTLRPFACSSSKVAAAGDDPSTQGSEAARAPDECEKEMDVDVEAYHAVCLARCNVTCQQRGQLFSQFGTEVLPA